MSLSYVKLENSEAKEARKTILSCQIDTINMINKINNYKSTRKSEIAKKSRLKTLVRQNMLRVSSLINELPQTEKMKTKPEKHMAIEIKKQKSMDAELEEIRRKLGQIL